MNQQNDGIMSQREGRRVAYGPFPTKRSGSLWIVVGLVCTLLLAGCGSDGESTPVSEDDLLIVWAEGGRLHTWNTGDDQPNFLAEDGVWRVFLAPDGQHVAFTRGEEEQDDSLWLINIDGGNLRQINAEPFLRQVAWLNAETLVFNTLTVDELGEVPRDDLHTVDVATGMVTSFDSGGHFSISPDDSRLLLIDPGSYQDQPARIQMVSIASDSDPVTLLEYPAIATGSHYHYYPVVHWQTGSSVRVALPDPDAVYQEFAEQTPPVALWLLTDSGSSQQRGTVTASYFGLPQWSADGTAMVYLQRGEDPNRFNLWIADGDGEDATLYQSLASAGDIPLPVWIGESGRFLYILDNAYWIGELGESPQKWLEGGELLLAQSFQLAESTLVYLALREDTIELRYANIEDDSGASTLIATSSGPPHFDVMVRD